MGNEYGKPKDVAGEQRTVFTSHADASFDVCFENILTGGTFLLLLLFPFLLMSALPSTVSTRVSSLASEAKR